MVLGIQHTALFFAAINNKPGVCLPLIAKGADLRVKNSPSNQSPLSHYGFSAYPHPAPLVKAQRVAELEAAFRAGCHPSQPHKDENWAKRWPPDECVDGRFSSVSCPAIALWNASPRFAAAAGGRAISKGAPTTLLLVSNGPGLSRAPSSPECCTHLQYFPLASQLGGIEQEAVCRSGFIAPSSGRVRGHCEAAHGGCDQGGGGGEAGAGAGRATGAAGSLLL